MLQGNTDDDDLFTPSNSTNLASLFGIAPMENTINLSYNAPKQPKNVDRLEELQPKQTSSIIFAKPVQLYKLVDKKYALFGKYGLAFIKNDVLNTYELILYKDKQNIFMRIKLASTFSLIMQAENFAAFVDDKKQYWTLNFENNDLKVFTQEIEKRGFKVVLNSSSKKSLDSSNDNVTVSNDNVPKSASEVDKGIDVNCNNSTKTKADILSRVVKMGQSILPSTQKETGNSEVDSSELTREIQSKTQSPPMEKQQNIFQARDTKEAVDISHVPQHNMNQQMLPMHNMFYSQPQVYPSQDHLQVFFAESRTHNTEVRMNLSQLSGKLDMMLAEFHKLRISENEVLKTKVEELEIKLHKLHETFNADNSSLPEQPEKDENIKLKQQNMLLENSIRELNKNIDELTGENNILKSKIKDLQEYSCKNEVVKADTISNEIKKVNMFSETIKSSMNEMYQDICQSFTEETYSSSELKKVLAQNIKTGTFKIIQDLKRTFTCTESQSLEPLKAEGTIIPPLNILT